MSALGLAELTKDNIVIFCQAGGISMSVTIVQGWGDNSDILFFFKGIKAEFTSINTHLLHVSN